MVLCLFFVFSCAFIFEAKRIERNIKNCFRFKVLYSIVFAQEGNLSFWYQFQVCLILSCGSLISNSWEWGFGNRVLYWKNIFLSRRGIRLALLYSVHAAYKNTTGDNRIFKVVLNGDGKSKQSWLTFGFL